MLEWLRGNIRSFHWVLWLVILTFVLSFAVIPEWGRGSGPGAGVAATVGNQEVSLDEFQRAYRNLEDQYRRSFGERFTPELARQMQLPLQVLQQLVAEKIQASEARRLGLSVSDDEMQRAVLDLPAFKDEAGQFIGQQQYSSFLRQIGFPSAQAFEDEMRESMLVQKLQAMMAANVYVPDTAVEASYKREVEKARIRYIELPASRFASEATVDAAEVKSYFDARKEDYRRPEQRVVSYLLVDANKMRNTIEIAPADIESYYEQHKDEYIQEEQIRARHILTKIDDAHPEADARARLEAAKRRLEGGADFAVVAKEVSEDPGSKDKGGDLGFFGRGRMIKEFEEAAFGAQPNQLVGPIRTSFGFHLIQVLERRAGGLRPLSEAQNTIRVRLQGERAQEQAETRATALAAQIKQDKLTTDDQLKMLLEGAPYLSFDKSPAFGQQDAVAQIGRVADFNAAAFALKPGAFSDPIKIGRGWVILRLDEARPPRVPELTEVEAQVRQALQRKKQEERALTRLTTARQEMSGGKSLDQIATELGVEVKDSGEFGHGQPVPGMAASGPLTEAALALNTGAVGGPIAASQGAVLFQVAERKSWDPAAFTKQKDETRIRLEGQEVQRLLAALVENRSRELDVRYDNGLLERMGVKLPSSKKS